jgi:aldehyde dehydrogenase
VLNAIADAIDAHAEMLAVTESWENGKPVRETLAADIPLAACCAWPCSLADDCCSWAS